MWCHVFLALVSTTNIRVIVAWWLLGHGLAWPDLSFAGIGPRPSRAVGIGPRDILTDEFLRRRGFLLAWSHQSSRREDRPGSETPWDIGIALLASIVRLGCPRSIYENNGCEFKNVWLLLRNILFSHRICWSLRNNRIVLLVARITKLRGVFIVERLEYGLIWSLLKTPWPNP